MVRKAAETDGRTRRGEENRRKIVEALLNLTRAGEMRPNAATVAQHAGVGVRTVFRHFDEMDTLYNEIARQTAARIMPIVHSAYTATTWRARLDELVTRRIHIFEEIMPLKAAGDIYRFRSPFLTAEYERHLTLERDTLDEVLPARIKKDKALREGLQMALSFHSWRQLRHDQKLGVEEAGETLRALLIRLVGPT
jgi:AcrR family transcriptional regulator